MASDSEKGLTHGPVSAPLGRSAGTEPLRPHAEPPGRPRPEMYKPAVGAILVLLLGCLITFLSSSNFNLISRYKVGTVENKEVETSANIMENKNEDILASTNKEVEISAITVKNKKVKISAIDVENKKVEVPAIDVENKKVESPAINVETKKVESPAIDVENKKVESPATTVETKKVESPAIIVENKKVKIPATTVVTKKVESPAIIVENKKVKIPATTVETKKVEIPATTVENKKVKIPAIVENKVVKIPASIAENKVVETSGIHIFSWIDFLDLPMLAVLINSTLSASRYPDDVFFHFYVPPEEDEKLSYYKLKVVIPNSNLEIVSQKNAKEKLGLSNHEGDSLQVFLNEAAAFIVPKSHLSLGKYVYISPNTIIKGQIENLFDTDLGSYAIGATVNCEKRLGNFVNIKVLNVIQRTGAKNWVSDKPYDKNACIPDFNLILVDPSKLNDNIAEVIMWWTNVLDLDIARSDHIRLAMALTLHNKYLEIPSSWKLQISENDETKSRESVKPSNILVQPDNKAGIVKKNEREVQGIHIFSWIDRLEFDLPLLAVLSNSTLSASRSPDDVFFHFFVPREEDEKLSYYKIKVAIPNSHLEIISQKDAKERLRLPNLQGDSMQVFLNEVAAPFFVPKSHLPLSKYIYISPNTIMKGQIEDLFGKDLGSYAIGAAENCEKRLGDLVNIEVLNKIQRSAAKSWVHDKPYDKNACIPNLNLILVNPKNLDDNLAEAIMWWIYVLDLEIARGDHVRLAVAITLHEKYLKLPSSWKLQISKNDERKVPRVIKFWIIISLVLAFLMKLIKDEDREFARLSIGQQIGPDFFGNLLYIGVFLLLYFNWTSFYGWVKSLITGLFGILW